MAREVSSKSIDGIVDLVVWAPVKEGFIHAFENVTYATRATLVAEALHKVRASLREHEIETFYSDTTERILSLFDFRIGIVDRDLLAADPARGAAMASVRPRQYLYVVATFDAALEPYMRLIWHPLGAFLDLLLCNCEGYRPATETPFAEYLQWVRDHQIDSAIFYATTGLSVRDEIYLTKLEKMQRRALRVDAAGSVASDADLAEMTLDFPEDLAAARRARALQHGFAGQLAVNRPALEALTVLYKLADFYPPDRLVPETPAEAIAAKADPDDPHPADGRFLLRAARSLLKEWDVAAIPPQLARAYAEPLAWFHTDMAKAPKMPTPPDPEFVPSEVQAGILTSLDAGGERITHGAMLLFQFKDVAKARAFLRDFPVQWEGDAPPADGIFRSLSLTYAGVRQLVGNDAVLRTFPQEFREGMAERAPMMGDVRENHPRRWTLPERNWPPLAPGEAQTRPPVEISELDFVVQLRWAPPPSLESGARYIDFRKSAEVLVNGAALDADVMESSTKGWIAPQHPIAAEIARLGTDQPGVQLVAVESMIRPQQPQGDDPQYPGSSVDHFGFRDGISQPEAVPGIGDDDPRGHLAGPADADHFPPPKDPPFAYSNQVRLGEVLLGFRNDNQDHAPQVDSGAAGERPRFPGWMIGSSFLVVRKIAQHRRAFDQVIGQQVGLPETLSAEEQREEIAARLVGRYRDGRPLVGTGNDFDYAADPKGQGCPLAAHIRRANPRDQFHGRRAPRLLRRGMSFGPDLASDGSNIDAPRGVMFMAYNASIAEQFETVQRWMNGGNSTGIASFQNDPLIGTKGKSGEQRNFRFVYGTGPDRRVIHVLIPAPLTSLHWGAYLFTPSRAALAYLTDDQIARTNELASRRTSTARGEDIIDRIEQLPLRARGLIWKAILEDFQTKDPTEKSIGPDVWRAIRARPGGVYRLPLRVPRDEGQSNSKLSDGWLKRTLRRINVLDAVETAMASTEAETLTPELEAYFGVGITLVGSAENIEAVFSDHRHFSVAEQGKRFSSTTSPIYITMDPDTPAQDYERESAATNRILFGDGPDDPDTGYAASFQAGYGIAAALLDRYKLGAQAVFDAAGGREKPYFKIELRRQFIMPALGELCRYWFDIPDNLDPAAPTKSRYVENGAWGWARPVKPAPDGSAPAPGTRKPRCPGDFMAQSRHAFYPRPTRSIRDYAYLHGAPLKAAVDALVADYRAGKGTVAGVVSKKMYDAIGPDQGDLLARNLLGIMVGMLPPSDANLRFILFEWLTEETLWQHQAALHRLTGHRPPSYDQAEAAFGMAMRRAMRKRPAPDLLFRTVKSATPLVPVRRFGHNFWHGEQVILGLLSATADDADAAGAERADVSPIFGGMRTAAVQPDGSAAHACPAYKMAMGSMLGILSALFDAGRIQAQPASLIIQISDWKRL